LQQCTWKDFIQPYDFKHTIRLSLGLQSKSEMASFNNMK